MNFRMAALILVLGSTACTSTRGTNRLRVVTDTWSIVQLSDSNEYVVVAKGGNDLKRALESMGCDEKPCTIGRLGNVYSVTTIVTPHQESGRQSSPSQTSQQ
jgi:hypothetical protein